MKPEKNQNQVNNEIIHIAKTIMPIVIFTIAVIIFAIITVSFMYDVPMSMMLSQFLETFKAVLTFASGK